MQKLITKNPLLLALLMLVVNSIIGLILWLCSQLLNFELPITVATLAAAFIVGQFYGLKYREMPRQKLLLLTAIWSTLLQTIFLVVELIRTNLLVEFTGNIAMLAVIILVSAAIVFIFIYLGLRLGCRQALASIAASVK